MSLNLKNLILLLSFSLLFVVPQVFAGHDSCSGDDCNSYCDGRLLCVDQTKGGHECNPDPDICYGPEGPGGGDQDNPDDEPLPEDEPFDSAQGEPDQADVCAPIYVGYPACFGDGREAEVCLVYDNPCEEGFEPITKDVDCRPPEGDECGGQPIHEEDDPGPDQEPVDPDQNEPEPDQPVEEQPLPEDEVQTRRDRSFSSECDPDADGPDPSSGWEYLGPNCDPDNPGNMGQKWFCKGTTRFAQDIADESCGVDASFEKNDETCEEEFGPTIYECNEQNQCLAISSIADGESCTESTRRVSVNNCEEENFCNVEPEAVEGGQCEAEDYYRCVKDECIHFQRDESCQGDPVAVDLDFCPNSCQNLPSDESFRGSVRELDEVCKFRYETKYLCNEDKTCVKRQAKANEEDGTCGEEEVEPPEEELSSCPQECNGKAVKSVDEVINKVEEVMGGKDAVCKREAGDPIFYCDAKVCIKKWQGFAPEKGQCIATFVTANKSEIPEGSCLNNCQDNEAASGLVTDNQTCEFKDPTEYKCSPDNTCIALVSVAEKGVCTKKERVINGFDIKCPTDCRAEPKPTAISASVKPPTKPVETAACPNYVQACDGGETFQACEAARDKDGKCSYKPGTACSPCTKEPPDVSINNKDNRCEAGVCINGPGPNCVTDDKCADTKPGASCSFPTRQDCAEGETRACRGEVVVNAKKETSCEYKDSGSGVSCTACTTKPIIYNPNAFCHQGACVGGPGKACTSNLDCPKPPPPPPTFTSRTDVKPVTTQITCYARISCQKDRDNTNTGMAKKTWYADQTSSTGGCPPQETVSAPSECPFGETSGAEGFNGETKTRSTTSLQSIVTQVSQVSETCTPGATYCDRETGLLIDAGGCLEPRFLDRCQAYVTSREKEEEAQRQAAQSGTLNRTHCDEQNFCNPTGPNRINVGLDCSVSYDNSDQECSTKYFNEKGATQCQSENGESLQVGEYCDPNGPNKINVRRDCVIEVKGDDTCLRDYRERVDQANLACEEQQYCDPDGPDMVYIDKSCKWERKPEEACESAFLSRLAAQVQAENNLTGPSDEIDHDKTYQDIKNSSRQADKESAEAQQGALGQLGGNLSSFALKAASCAPPNPVAVVISFVTRPECRETGEQLGKFAGDTANSVRADATQAQQYLGEPEHNAYCQNIDEQRRVILSGLRGYRGTAPVPDLPSDPSCVLDTRSGQTRSQAAKEGFTNGLSAEEALARAGYNIQPTGDPSLDEEILNRRERILSVAREWHEKGAEVTIEDISTWAGPGKEGFIRNLSLLDPNFAKAVFEGAAVSITPHEKATIARGICSEKFGEAACTFGQSDSSFFTKDTLKDEDYNKLNNQVNVLFPGFEVADRDRVKAYLSVYEEIFRGNSRNEAGVDFQTIEKYINDPNNPFRKDIEAKLGGSLTPEEIAQVENTIRYYSATSDYLVHATEEGKLYAAKSNEASAMLAVEAGSNLVDPTDVASKAIKLGAVAVGAAKSVIRRPAVGVAERVGEEVAERAVKATGSSGERSAAEIVDSAEDRARAEAAQQVPDPQTSLALPAPREETAVAPVERPFASDELAPSGEREAVVSPRSESPSGIVVESVSEADEVAPRVVSPSRERQAVSAEPERPAVAAQAEPERAAVPEPVAAGAAPVDRPAVVAQAEPAVPTRSEGDLSFQTESSQAPTTRSPEDFETRTAVAPAAETDGTTTTAAVPVPSRRNGAVGRAERDSGTAVAEPPKLPTAIIEEAPTGAGNPVFDNFRSNVTTKSDGRLVDLEVESLGTDLYVSPGKNNGVKFRASVKSESGLPPNIKNIDVPARREGTGTALVTAWEETVATQGYQMTGLTNVVSDPGSQAFWRALGYEPAIPGKDYLWVKPLTPEVEQQIKLARDLALASSRTEDPLEVFTRNIDVRPKGVESQVPTAPRPAEPPVKVVEPAEPAAPTVNASDGGSIVQSPIKEENKNFIENKLKDPEFRSLAVDVDTELVVAMDQTGRLKDFPDDSFGILPLGETKVTLQVRRSGDGAIYVASADFHRGLNPEIRGVATQAIDEVNPAIFGQKRNVVVQTSYKSDPYMGALVESRVGQGFGDLGIKVDNQSLGLPETSVFKSSSSGSNWFSLVDTEGKADFNQAVARLQETNPNLILQPLYKVYDQAGREIGWKVGFTDVNKLGFWERNELKARGILENRFGIKTDWIDNLRAQAEQNKFLKTVGLTRDSVLYRYTPSEFVQDGFALGNPGSNAEIFDYFNKTQDIYGPSPRVIRAYELGVPTLNVAKIDPVLYGDPNSIRVGIRVGDILDQGGRIYYDNSSTSSYRALIVSVPEGKVPASSIKKPNGEEIFPKGKNPESGFGGCDLQKAASINSTIASLNSNVLGLQAPCGPATNVAEGLKGDSRFQLVDGVLHGGLGDAVDNTASLADNGLNAVGLDKPLANIERGIGEVGGRVQGRIDNLERDWVLAIDMGKHRVEQSIRRNNEIRSFSTENDLVIKEYVHNNKKILLIDDESSPGLGQERVERYLQEQEIAEKEGIAGNCFFIAEGAVGKRIASGSISTSFGASDFTGRVNHCINFEILPDNSIVAFDLTATRSVDADQGNFAVLAIKASNMEELKRRLNKLYGGDWQVRESGNFKLASDINPPCLTSLKEDVVDLAQVNSNVLGIKSPCAFPQLAGDVLKGARVVPGGVGVVAEVVGTVDGALGHPLGSILGEIERRSPNGLVAVAAQAKSILGSVKSWFGDLFRREAPPQIDSSGRLELSVSKAERGILSSPTSAIDFIKSQTFDPEKRYFRFEFDPKANSLTQEDLRALLDLPFEVSLEGKGGKLELVTGKLKNANGPDVDRRILKRGRSTQFYLHTHPNYVDGIETTFPSFADLIVVEDMALPDTPQLLITPSGVIAYRRPQVNDQIRSSVSNFTAKNGVDLMGGHKDLRQYTDLTKQEQLDLTIKYAQEYNVVVRSASWDDAEGLQEILDIVNLKKVKTPEAIEAEIQSKFQDRFELLRRFGPCVSGKGASLNSTLASVNSNVLGATNCPLTQALAEGAEVAELAPVIGVGVRVARAANSASGNPLGVLALQAERIIPTPLVDGAVRGREIINDVVGRARKGWDEFISSRGESQEVLTSRANKTITDALADLEDVDVLIYRNSLEVAQNRLDLNRNKIKEAEDLLERSGSESDQVLVGLRKKIEYAKIRQGQLQKQVDLKQSERGAREKLSSARAKLEELDEKYKDSYSYGKEYFTEHQNIREEIEEATREINEAGRQLRAEEKHQAIIGSLEFSEPRFNRGSETGEYDWTFESNGLHANLYKTTENEVFTTSEGLEIKIPQGTTVAKVDFLPLGKPSFEEGYRTIPLAKGSVGMEDLLSFLDTKYKASGGIEPAYLIGYTNPRMAEAATRLGFQTAESGFGDVTVVADLSTIRKKADEARATLPRLRARAEEEIARARKAEKTRLGIRPEPARVGCAAASRDDVVDLASGNSNVLGVNTGCAIEETVEMVKRTFPLPVQVAGKLINDSTGDGLSRVEQGLIAYGKKTRLGQAIEKGTFKQSGSVKFLDRIINGREVEIVPIGPEFPELARYNALAAKTGIPQSELLDMTKGRGALWNKPLLEELERKAGLLPPEPTPTEWFVSVAEAGLRAVGGENLANSIRLAPAYAKTKVDDVVESFKGLFRRGEPEPRLSANPCDFIPGISFLPILSISTAHAAEPCKIDLDQAQRAIVGGQFDDPNLRELWRTSVRFPDKESAERFPEVFGSIFGNRGVQSKLYLDTPSRDYLGAVITARKIVLESWEDGRLFTDDLTKFRELMVEVRVASEYRESLIPDFRTVDSRDIKSYWPNIDVKDVRKIAMQYQDEFAQDLDPKTYKVKVTHVVRKINLEGISEEGKPRMELLAIKVGRNKVDFDELDHIMPSPKYADEYLKQMQLRLKAYSEKQGKESVGELANFYQYCINGRFFYRINHSFCMNIVNTGLEVKGLRGLNQSIFDFAAYSLQPDSFRRFFTDEVEKVNSGKLDVKLGSKVDDVVTDPCKAASIYSNLASVNSNVLGAQTGCSLPEKIFKWVKERVGIKEKPAEGGPLVSTRVEDPFVPVYIIQAATNLPAFAGSKLPGFIGNPKPLDEAFAEMFGINPTQKALPPSSYATPEEVRLQREAIKKRTILYEPNLLSYEGVRSLSEKIDQVAAQTTDKGTLEALKELRDFIDKNGFIFPEFSQGTNAKSTRGILDHGLLPKADIPEGTSAYRGEGASINPDRVNPEAIAPGLGQEGLGLAIAYAKLSDDPIYLRDFAVDYELIRAVSAPGVVPEDFRSDAFDEYIDERRREYQQTYKKLMESDAYIRRKHKREYPVVFGFTGSDKVADVFSNAYIADSDNFLQGEVQFGKGQKVLPGQLKVIAVPRRAVEDLKAILEDQGRKDIAVISFEALDQLPKLGINTIKKREEDIYNSGLISNKHRVLELDKERARLYPEKPISKPQTFIPFQEQIVANLGFITL